MTRSGLFARQALAVAGKGLKEGAREPQIALLFLFLPAFFIFVYYLAFAQIGNSLASWLKLVAVDQDGGRRAASLVAALEDSRFEGAAALSVRREMSLSGARALLAEGGASIILVLPKGFETEGRLVIERDPRSDTAAFAETMARGVAEEWAATAKPGQRLGMASRIDYQFLPGTGTLNDFQLAIPGLLIFGISFGVLTQALFLVRESSRGTLARLRLSPLGAGGFLAGFTLSNLGLSGAQACIAWLAALACGFHAAGGAFIPVIVLFIYSLAVTGCGLLTACMTVSEAGAATLCMVFIGPLAFLSGAAFPLPAMNLFSAFGKTVSIQDFLPSGHAVTALTDLMVYGRQPSPYSMAGLSILTLALLFIGALVYRRSRLRAY
jgi:ABC-2 type transport system permease protein